LSLQVCRKFINSRIPENWAEKALGKGCLLYEIADRRRFRKICTLSCWERWNIYIRRVDCFIGKAMQSQLSCSTIFSKCNCKSRAVSFQLPRKIK
jgi:hypothetical protein